MFLAFGLMMLVLFATPYFFKGQPKPGEPPKKEVVAAKPVAPPPDVPKPKADVKAASAVPATAAAQETTTIVETDRYKVLFSNRGAVVKSWILKDYKDSSNKPVDLNQFGRRPQGRLGVLVALQEPEAFDRTQRGAVLGCAT